MGRSLEFKGVSRSSEEFFFFFFRRVFGKIRRVSSIHSFTRGEAEESRRRGGLGAPPRQETRSPHRQETGNHIRQEAGGPRHQEAASREESCSSHTLPSSASSPLSQRGGGGADVGEGGGGGCNGDRPDGDSEGAGGGDSTIVTRTYYYNAHMNTARTCTFCNKMIR